MIVGEPIKYFCAVLNSNLIILYLSLILAGDSYTYGSGKIFEKIPIPMLSSKQQKIFSTLVGTILKPEESNTNEIKNAINQKIYELYGLSEEEIAFIESK